jgi:hypothetical protein
MNPGIPIRPFAWAAVMVLLCLPAASRGAPVSQAAAFYHQGHFDSALARLEALRDTAGLKRRDSLSLHQYLGMATARLDRAAEAEGHFIDLLGLDSLFQFPRNEDPAVLAAFDRARTERAERSRPRLAPPPEPVAQTFGPAFRDTARIPEAPAAAPAPSPIPFALPVASGDAGARTVPKIGLAMGALPFGTGWFSRRRTGHGLVLGILQAGGIILSIYASDRQTRSERDSFGVQDQDELSSVQGWQWVQRVSLSTALGAYVFSLIASAGD